MNKKYKKYNIWIGGKDYPCIWVDGKEVKLHVYVWEEANGSKPKGHDIHHIDGDKGNYNLDNLALVTPSEHRRIHAGWIRKDDKWISKPCNYCDKVLPLEDFYFIGTRNIESNYCKDCHNKIIVQRNKLPENKEKLKIYKRDYYRRRYGKQK